MQIIGDCKRCSGPFKNTSGYLSCTCTEKGRCTLTVFCYGLLLYYHDKTGYIMELMYFINEDKYGT